MKKIVGITGLLLAILFMTTCSSQKLSKVDTKEIQVISELREKINKHINDKEKRGALLTITDEMEQETRRFFSFYQEHNKKLTLVNNDYHATRKDFDEITNEFNEEYENYLRMLVKKRTAMRELTSDDEWKKIMDREYSFIPG
jgi:DUF4097 and DUF4098 domain-containing protein YvlB